MAKDLLKEKILELHKEGYTRSKIRRYVNASWETVDRIMKEEGITPNMTQKQRTALKGYDRAEIIKYCEEGYTLEEIAILKNVSDATVSKWTKEIGVKKNEKAYKERLRQKREKERLEALRRQGAKDYARCKRFKQCVYGTQNANQRCDYYLLTGKRTKYVKGKCKMFVKGRKKNIGEFQRVPGYIDPHKVEKAMRER